MASKSALQEEKNLDEEPPLPPHKAFPGAKPVVLSQEDEWKLIVNQDPLFGSVARALGME